MMGLEIVGAPFL